MKLSKILGSARIHRARCMVCYQDPCIGGVNCSK